LSVVHEVVTHVAPTAGVDRWNVVHAMCLPARGRIEPFPGTRELLERLVERRLRVVLATNVMWRTAADQCRDLDDFGLAGYVSACVTSLDVGWRKPHRRFYAALLDAARCPPAECAMVGDSEVNDIIPARDLGMLTIKVGVQKNRAPSSAATHVCASLSEVGMVILDHLNTGP
jgi:HAD superfamily hydrolase (TIGR01509 family)